MKPRIPQHLQKYLKMVIKYEKRKFEITVINFSIKDPKPKSTYVTTLSTKNNYGKTLNDKLILVIFYLEYTSSVLQHLVMKSDKRKVAFS